MCSWLVLTLTRYPMGKVFVTLYNTMVVIHTKAFILHVLALYLYIVTCMCLVEYVGLFFYRLVHVLRKQVAKNQQHVSMC